MPTPRPDSAPVTGAADDQTVRLGAGPEDADGTVRLTSAPGGAEETVRLGSAPKGAEETVLLASAPEGPEDAAQTVRLGSAPAADERTVKLDGGAGVPAGGGPDSEATARLDGDDAASATFLDPRVWGDAPEAGETTTRVQTPAYGSTVPVPPLTRTTEATGPAGSGTTSSPRPTPADGSPDERPLAPGELRRFGPGVPPQAAAVWHGAAGPEPQKPRRPRRVWRWLVPAAVLLAVLAFLFWRLTMPALAVTGVGVTTDSAGPGCGGTAVITAGVETNGGAGTLRYRWLRSDGTTSGELSQDVRVGAHRTDLVLRWSFEGQGSLQATATLEILSPDTRTAAASFAYRCP
ncbi:hypothetical protein OG535_03655 [Kitasatospora sp. NBC_00085]|uniref:hypothetical protein n=1 Tax=unclassified Kitasatospora TaxID=2633591 RepID=UPI002F911C1D